jgi:hypothetical protein
MRKLILKMSITLDGFVGGPNGEIDWIFKTMSEDAAAWTVDKILPAGAQWATICLGWRRFWDRRSLFL